MNTLPTKFIYIIYLVHLVHFSAGVRDISFSENFADVLNGLFQICSNFIFSLAYSFKLPQAKIEYWFFGYIHFIFYVFGLFFKILQKFLVKTEKTELWASIMQKGSNEITFVQDAKAATGGVL